MIKIDNIDNIQLSKEEILKSMSVIINKYSKEKIELEAIVMKNETKPYLDIRITLKENTKYKARIILKKFKNQQDYCASLHHHYWIAQYVIGIKRSLELQLLMRVLRKWR